ncbi:quinolinate synthase NadA, partial [Mycobacterium tuberculosis]|nr:quinolinate synthase NadA [Mycobacterium tuberculosis]
HRVLFFPDQHLGRNTAIDMGIDPEAMPLWNPRRPLGNNTAEVLEDSRVILWQGFCSVHKRFTPAQIAAAREADPDVRVIVHPECPRE